jgi:aspartate-semialdehyde dehydrogenase
VYKIAIAGASSLIARELKDALSDSPLAAANFVLLDEEDAKDPTVGQLDQVGDEATFIQAIADDAFEHADFTFFCGSEEMTRRHWITALRAGSSVIDLSGALDEQKGVVVRAPWLGRQENDGARDVDLETPAVVPAHPAALVLALLLERLQSAVTVRFAAATVMLPASEIGRAAMDELHQQTVNLLSFQSLPQSVYDAQVAYNLLGGLGESATASLPNVEARIRRHYSALTSGPGNHAPELTLQVIHAPVFHGHTFVIALELEQPLELVTLEEALCGEHVELVREDTDSPSNLAATGQDNVLVRLRPDAGARDPEQISRLWIWAASDNLRLNAQNAVQCAMDLRRLRPQGKVQ